MNEQRMCNGYFSVPFLPFSSCSSKLAKSEWQALRSTAYPVITALPFLPASSKQSVLVFFSASVALV